ncbi:pyrimidine oxygenase [Roseovarius pacificus]|uniref:Pyrimidine oxygenase n=1 Tax=Roseovarius pacificus TaxID=337701 RepID=A0A1M7L049_9RHOB|nr:LLM class flavin-dependent oxidoreductase [Roseovarius pacificus]GGO63239.1 pyrimidine monooxygenase RutA [Roseovarius pacificus]SHM71231.1 pyrimidine oxygenase [Roseovarius pacificus]
MKLGVFLPNGQNGYIISKNSPQYIPTWEHMLEITQEAERVGLDFILSMIKYRGFGGETGYWDSCSDSIALACGLAAATDQIELYATVPMLGVHPAIAARMITTFNDISNGRAGVNFVTGWNKPEYSQMGLWPGEDYHANRFGLAEEYMRVVRDLWRDGRSNFKGKHYHLEDCECFPVPGREIPVVYAGQSPKGIEFTADYAEYNFMFGGPDKLRKASSEVRAASARVGRDVGTLALYTIIGADTDEDAAARCQEIVDGADEEALMNIVKSASMDNNPDGTSKHFRDGMTAPVEEGNLVFMGFPVIHGSWETIALKIKDLGERTGVSGMLLTFPDFVDGVKKFGKYSLPILRPEKTKT